MCVPLHGAIGTNFIMHYSYYFHAISVPLSRSFSRLTASQAS